MLHDIKRGTGCQHVARAPPTNAHVFLSDIPLNTQGIEVLEVNSRESYYRAAGNPVAGFLAYGIGAGFVVISFFAEHGPRVRFATRAIVTWSTLSLVIIFFSTFDQLAGK